MLCPRRKESHKEIRDSNGISKVVEYTVEKFLPCEKEKCAWWVEKRAYQYDEITIKPTKKYDDLSGCAMKLIAEK